MPPGSPNRPKKYLLSEVRTASPIVRDLMTALDASDMTRANLARDSGVCANSLWRWRCGHASPRVSELEYVAQTLGYEVVLRRKA